MRYFSTAYKKKFKQLLQPLGYKNRKSVFIKLEDDIFFVIAAKGKFTGEQSTIWTFISPCFYCDDVTPDDFELRDLVENMFSILQWIAPDKFTMEKYISLISAKGEDATLRSLDSVCEVLAQYVLPYIHRFSDLEYYYNEACQPKEHNGFTRSIELSNDDLFYLSIKLRKYENAMIYLERKALFLDNNISGARYELAEMRSGNISEPLLMVQKRKPEVIQLRICSAEQAIVDWERELSDLQVMKDALLSSDHNYLYDYIKKTENRCRECLGNMLI